MSKIGILSLILALLALGGGVFGYQLIRHQQREIAELRSEVAAFSPRFDQFKGAVREIGHQLTSMVMEEIDLNRSGWQSIGKGFYLIDAVAAPSPDAKGVLLRGKVINTTAVIHEALVFRARIGNQGSTFKVERAAPGVALPFEVTVPTGTPADGGTGQPPTAPGGVPAKGFVTLESSTISFASSTGKAPAPREPIDLDKTLR